MLVAYAKLAVKKDLLASDLPDDPYLASTLGGVLPAADLRAGYARRARRAPAAPRDRRQRRGQLDGQPGRDHLRLPGAGGAGATPEQVARAFVICREVFGLADYVAEVEALDNTVETEVQTRLYLEFRRLLDRSVRWFLASRATAVDIRSEIERFADVVARARPEGARGCSRATSARGSSAGPPSSRRPGSRPTCAPGRPACSTGTHCSTSSTSPPTPDARRLDRAAVLPHLRELRHRHDAGQGDPAARARTAGTPWPGARCATTSTRCSSR